MAETQLGRIDGAVEMRANEGLWMFDEADWLLIALLQDPVNCAELLFEDPKNVKYGGCYTVYDYQYPLFRYVQSYQIYPCARSVGKALADTQLVLTPHGTVEMGALRVGDFVVGSDGAPTRILAVHPQGERDIWRVTFGDGAEVECDDEHLWTVACDSWIHRGCPERTLSLREIRQRRAQFKVRLPSGPVQFAPEPPLPLEPWLMGALLGDGNLSRPTMVRFASVDEPILARVRATMPADVELVHDDGCNYRFRGYDQRRTQRGMTAHSLLVTTRTLGMQGHRAHEKRIPDAYLTASVEDRIELLRGLADTDGSVTHAGSVEISSASWVLAHDIRSLALGLGGRASVRRGPTPRRDRWRVVLRIPGINPFHLPRKAELYEARTALRRRDRDWRSIARIERVARAPATCIEVAAQDGLFMTGDYVLTHNTESAKARAVSHAFRRMGEEMLITAPELIHLEGLTGPIENRIMDTRLTRDFLKSDGQRTGITHKPGLRVEFADGTSIAGRIPHQTGKGIKGAHVPDLIMDEAQDYPERGYIEIQEVVMKDHVDSTGAYDFTYHAYGVYASGHGGKFQDLADSGLYKVTTITAPMRPGWNKQEKQSAAAMYGGTNSPDYRRNVLGEPGQALSQFFVTARLMACMDQNRESHYNTAEFKHQEIRAEDLERLIGPKGDPGDLLDLPTNLGQEVYCGMDVGLVTDPTVIKIYTVGQDERRKSRLKLVRMIHLWRFTEKQIRLCTYKIALQYGKTLRAFGQDIGGLGLPLYQAMDSDEQCPAHLREIARGYVFNAKVPVAVDKNYVSEQGGKLVDQYGHMVEEVRDKWTGNVQLVARMTMIEASTRYLRRWVDDGWLMFPFHPDLIKDFQGETEQRVRAMAGARKKPNAFHMLDASRVMAMAYHAAQLEEQVYSPKHTPVLDRAVSVG